jgi:hypothetical protein
MLDSGANAEMGAKQKMMIEPPSFDVDAMQEMKNKMELDEIQDFKLNIEDQTAEMNDRQDGASAKIKHVQDADEDLAGKSTEQ